MKCIKYIQNILLLNLKGRSITFLRERGEGRGEERREKRKGEEGRVKECH